MKKKVAVFALLGALFIFSFAVLAEAATVTITNNTGVTIEEMYMSDSGTDDWEEDMLEEVLEHGETLRVNIDGSYELFDLLVVTEAGQTVTFKQLPGGISKMTLNNDGSANVQ